MACYKIGGCGVYEMYSCSECPASKLEYLNKKVVDNYNDNTASKEEAVSHFKYGISRDIFKEPVTSYARMAVEALEKQIAVKPQLVDGRFYCPSCHSNNRALDVYCDKCGQKIDWESIMTEQRRKEAIEHINGQLENGYIDLGSHDQDELDIVKEAMNMLRA